MNLYFISVWTLFEQRDRNKVSISASDYLKRQKIKTSPKARFSLYSVFVFRGDLLELQSDIMAFFLARL